MSIQRIGRSSFASATLALTLVMACGGTVTETVAPSASAGPTPAGSNSAGPTPAASTSTGLPPDLTIPPAPAMAPAPQGSIDEQASALAQAVAPGGQAALAPLLAAYRAAGIPVIGSDGLPMSGFEDDQVGPGWWQVWLSAGANPKFAVSLADATKLITVAPEASALGSAEVAAAALADLRSMAGDADPHRRFFARFLAELSTARSGVDVLAATTTPDAVKLSPIAVEFFTAGLLRSLALAVVATDPASARGSGAMFASVGAPLTQDLVRTALVAPAGNPCNPTGDFEAVSFWTQWIASKLVGGLNLPGMEDAMKSSVQLVIKNAGLAGKIGTALPIVSGAISALTFMLQMSALFVTFGIEPPEGLTRTHASHPHGLEATITVHLKYDLEGSALDGGAGIKNCLLVFLNSLGIQASLPADGGIEGAKLTFKGGTGFGERTNTGDAFVQFPNQEEISRETGEGGIRTITIQGIQQKETIPDGASEWYREASVSIRAQPEAENLRSLAGQFFDSFVAIPSGPMGMVSPMIGVLKTVEYDLGEQAFLVKDWRLGWVYAPSPDTVYGKKCDGGLGGLWVINVNANSAGSDNRVSWVATIDAATLTGTYNYESAQSINGVTQTTQLTGAQASLTLEPGGVVNMILQGGQGTLTIKGGGVTTTVPAPLPQGWSFSWSPAGDKCDPA